MQDNDMEKVERQYKEMSYTTREKESQIRQQKNYSQITQKLKDDSDGELEVLELIKY